MSAFKRIALVNAIVEKLNLKFLGWHYLFLLFFFGTLPFLAGILPIVRFTDEQIDIRVFADHVVMLGTYGYQNPFPFPVVQGLSVPLPIDSEHPTPVQISARRLGPEQRPLVTRYLLGHHRFNLFFKANERIQIAVEYRQQAPQKNATYLLTTTKPWKLPLERGVYRLMPQQVVITHSNYALAPEGNHYIGFERQNFMPQENWSFSWEVN